MGRPVLPNMPRKPMLLNIHIIMQPSNSLSEKDAVLSLKVGAFKYKYTLSDNSVVRETLPPDEILAIPAHDDYLEEIKFKEMMELLTPPVEAAAVVVGGSTFVNALKNLRSAPETAVDAISGPAKIAWLAAILVGGGTGGFFGYKLGYDEKDHLENSIVKETLMNKDTYVAKKLGLVGVTGSQRRRPSRGALITTSLPDEGGKKHGAR
jgi:hypothetical protein